jgi:hypothetical protein
MFKNLVIRLSKLPHLVVLLGALASAGSAWAEDQPNPGDAGTFLGRTVACGCVSADAETAFPVYLWILQDMYGQTFADQAYGHMKLALREAYDNQLFICRYVCGRDVIADLQEALDVVGEMPGRSIVASNDGVETGEASLETQCRSQMSRPDCRRAASSVESPR